MTRLRRYAIEPPFRSSRKPEVNTSELVAKIAEAHSVRKMQAQAVVDSMLKSITSAAANGEEISLPGFGKFKVKETPEREGRNPTSGEKIKIAASQELTYSPAKAVRELLNG
jgi:DNA-binding protein HU-beta